jgi:hypothetical protein
LSIEVGAAVSPELRVVDIWAAGKHLTTDDNVAFVPFLARAMRSTAALVRRNDVAQCPFPGRSPEEIFRVLDADKTSFRERFWFIQWGEIIDNVARYAYRDVDDLVFAFAFWRPRHAVADDLGRVFVARLEPGEFATAVEDAADILYAKA